MANNILAPQVAQPHKVMRSNEQVILNLPAVLESVEYFGSCVVPVELERADYGFTVHFPEHDRVLCALIPIFQWEGNTYVFSGWMLLDPRNEVAIDGVGITKGV